MATAEAVKIASDLSSCLSGWQDLRPVDSSHRHWFAHVCGCPIPADHNVFGWSSCTESSVIDGANSLGSADSASARGG